MRDTRRPRRPGRTYRAEPLLHRPFCKGPGPRPLLASKAVCLPPGGAGSQLPESEPGSASQRPWESDFNRPFISSR